MAIHTEVNDTVDATGTMITKRAYLSILKRFEGLTDISRWASFTPGGTIVRYRRLKLGKYITLVSRTVDERGAISHWNHVPDNDIDGEIQKLYRPGGSARGGLDFTTLLG